MISQEMIDRLNNTSWFQEWLHGGGSVRGPIRIPQMGVTPGIDVVTIKLREWAEPAPWAIREYRYLCYVAVTEDGQEVARSESWRWFNPLDNIIGARIPPHEGREHS